MCGRSDVRTQVVPRPYVPRPYVNMRIQIIRNITIALFALIAFDLFFLQVIRGGYFYRLSQNNSIRLIPFEGKRGRVLDRDGRVLVDNSKSFHALILPQDLGKDRGVFRFLSLLLNEDAAAIENRYLKNRLTPFSPVTVAEDISRQEAIQIEEGAYRFPGLIVLEKYRREYACKEACAHAVGYVGKADPEKFREIAEYGLSTEELVGYSGVEESYNGVLRGAPGGRQIEVDSRGREVRLLSVRDPSEGKDLALTIDSRIQHAAYDALGGARGAAVILDADTGEVLALVSSPSFDPNAFTDRDKRAHVADYLADKASPLLNRAMSAGFPPGSVFKIPVAVAGLEERKIQPSTTFDCPGFFQLGNRVFRSPHSWGMQDLTEAMGHSANDYFFHTGLLLGPEMITRYARQFGLGERTGVDLPYESRGQIPSVAKFLHWFKGDTLNLAIGQGTVLATPLQLARLMAVVANEGRFVTPHVVKSVGGVDICGGATDVRRKTWDVGRERENASVPRPSSLVPRLECPQSKRYVPLRKDVWSVLRQILYAPVKMDTGTAHVLDIDGLDTFGKTGTAQASPGKSDHAWFAGVTMTPKRRIAYCVLLEHGGSSANACEVVKVILQSLKEQSIL